ncbi:MAG: cytochrome b/b6 domain-containing protein [Acidobacteriota bacterium]
MATVSSRQIPATPRHAVVVRLTHWLTVIAFLGLLISGGEILLSHPRFYWGESGNPNMRPLFSLPLPTSRPWVNNGFGTAMPDGNGWGRYLHFEAAWLVVLTGVAYVLWGLWRGHFRQHLLPQRGERLASALWRGIRKPLLGGRSGEDDERSYNALQRMTYLGVIFVLFPMVIWTGLAMSPSFTGAFPATASLLGGRQSARTLHFVISLLLVGFFGVHVTMVALAGFWRRTRTMITGRAARAKEEA